MSRAFAHPNNAKVDLTVFATVVTANNLATKQQQCLIENLTGGALVYALDADPVDATSGELQAGDWRIISLCQLNGTPAEQVRLKRFGGGATGRVLVTFGEGL
jgi:hypothetical protein